MSDQQKSPESNNEAPKEKQPEQSLIDLAEEYFESWKPVLRFEGTQLLGKRLAITTATVAHLVRDNDILRASNKNLHDRLLHVEKAYTDLCKANDENKLLHLELGTRQKKHVDTCDTNFKKLKEAIEKLLRRFGDGT